jgi:enoyl-CoA hydratase/carnithine racemase
MNRRSENLQVERRGEGVVALWLDRPAARNALDGDLVEALARAFRLPEARAFVLGSTDSRCFCAGADLGLTDAERSAVSSGLYELYATMLRTPAPIVAAIEGPAVGGGAQLAIASDVRIGSPDARFRFPGPGHGLSVGAWALPSLVGRGRAIDLCLTMRAIDAEEAFRIGLLDRLEPDAREAACAAAAGFARLVPEAAARVKTVAGVAGALLQALEAERDGNASWSGSVEGLAGS